MAPPSSTAEFCEIVQLVMVRLAFDAFEIPPPAPLLRVLLLPVTVQPLIVRVPRLRIPPPASLMTPPVTRSPCNVVVTPGLTSTTRPLPPASRMVLLAALLPLPAPMSVRFLLTVIAL